MAERFLFLPSLGFCIAAVALILRLFKVKDFSSLKLNSKARIAFITILILGAARTIARNPDWKNNQALFGVRLKNFSEQSRGYFSDTEIYTVTVSNKRQT